MSVRAMMIRTAGDPALARAAADAVLSRELRDTRAELEKAREELKRVSDVLEGGRRIQVKRDAVRLLELTKRLDSMGRGLGYRVGESIAVVIVGAKLIAGLFGRGEMKEYFERRADAPDVKRSGESGGSPFRGD